MEKVRIGVVGCGVIGPTHIRYGKYSEKIEFIAVADKVKEKAEKVAKEYGVKKVYTEAEELLKDSEVDAVVLAMPTSMRTKLAIEAFRNGKHVLLEKPVAMNSEEVMKMLEAKGELICGCCSSRYRFLPSSEFATKFVESGSLGSYEPYALR